MDSQLTLNDELHKLVEARMEHTLEGIEDTLRRVQENQEMNLKDLKKKRYKALKEASTYYPKNGISKYSTHCFSKAPLASVD